MVAIPNSLLLWTAVLILLTFGIPALFTPKNFMSAIQKFMKNEDATRLWGFGVLIFAFLFFMVHYALVWAWSIIFFILWILSVIKGLAMIRYPKLSAKGGTAFYTKKGFTIMVGIFLILLTIIFIGTAIL
jgi:hypothetical protein